MLDPVRRGIAVLVTIALAALAGLVVMPAVAASPAGAQADFYTPPSPLPAGQPGDIIRTEPISYANATGTRIMYQSRDLRGQPMAVTGTVVVPNTPWPGGGPRPVVAYAPMTSGMGDQCAVSHTIAGDNPGDLVSGVQTAFVNALLAKGIAVAQTDYQGLGTPGTHTYMVRIPQARATLDVVRAAQRLPNSGLPANGPVGIAGYSQGGAASAAAAEAAPAYAPELDIRGVYSGAPAADLATLARTLDGGFYVAFLFFALIGADAAVPEVGIGDLTNAAGQQVMEQANTLCTFESVLSFAFRQSSTLTQDGRPVHEYLAEEPFSSLVEANRVGNGTPEAPVLVEHASLDDIIPQSIGREMAQRWCSRGAQVQFNDLFTFLPIFVHLLQGNTAATNAANWLSGRFSGTPATSNCASI